VTLPSVDLTGTPQGFGIRSSPCPSLNLSSHAIKHADKRHPYRKNNKIDNLRQVEAVTRSSWRRDVFLDRDEVTFEHH
jgi:hypothetical protein